ncbi:RNA-directed DNA polymerase from mobile element jockey [Trichonephila clavipes]|nr:RNA-directed DNA polymerase from mobile element jockey [Trichonephila clavipes]
MRSTLNRSISPKSKLALRYKVLLYKAILRPIMLYASPIWAGAAVTHLKRLHTFQNIRLRIASNAPWFVRNEVLHTDLNDPPLLDFIKNNQKISSTGYHRFQMNLSEKSRLTTTILFLALLRDLEQFLITRINTSQF